MISPMIIPRYYLLLFLQLIFDGVHIASGYSSHLSHISSLCSLTQQCDSIVGMRKSHMVANLKKLGCLQVEDTVDTDSSVKLGIYW